MKPEDIRTLADLSALPGLTKADALVDVCTHPERAAVLGRTAYQFYANKRTLDMMLYGFRRAIEGW